MDHISNKNIKRIKTIILLPEKWRIQYTGNRDEIPQTHYLNEL